MILCSSSRTSASDQVHSFLEALPDRRLSFREANTLVQANTVFAVDKIIQGSPQLVDGLIIVWVDFNLDGFVFSDEAGEWNHIESGNPDDARQIAEAVEDAIEHGEVP